MKFQRFLPTLFYGILTLLPVCLASIDATCHKETNDLIYSWFYSYDVATHPSYTDRCLDDPCTIDYSNIFDFTELVQKCYVWGGIALQQEWRYYCMQNDDNGAVLSHETKFKVVPMCVGYDCAWSDLPEMTYVPAQLDKSWLPKLSNQTEGWCTWNLTDTIILFPEETPAPTRAPVSCSTANDDLLPETEGRARLTIGFTAGATALNFIFWSNIAHTLCRGYCCRDWREELFFIGLEATNFGIGFAFAGRPPTAEERCEGISFVTESYINMVVVLFSFTEICYSIFCWEGDSFVKRRLGPGTGWTRWAVILPCLFLGFWSSLGIVIDYIRSDFRWYWVILFGIYGVLAFGYCCWLVYVGEHHSVIWAKTQWICLDCPGIFAILIGLDGDIWPFIAQLIIEAILLNAEGEH
eukprot:Nitzschia sp. Nitz4//scaffold87_size112219//2165//3394//NITZ4_004055-RA/size112219-processed-gene-0.98-mRNA-1//1//CDS//3329559312//7502//frame0